jgi:hypothetical protein
MTEYLIETLLPTLGQVPDNGTDIAGNTYTEWALNDEATFSFVLPSTYTTGTDIILVIHEASPTSAKNHKWKFTVLAKLLYSEIHYGSYTSTTIAWTESIRTVTCSISGTVGSYALQAGDAISITMKRTAADSQEDSASIRVYTIVATLTTSAGPTTTCLGRVGATVSKVLTLFNDDSQKFLNQTEIVGWINEAIYEIAVLGYWHKQTLINVVAAQASYNLTTLIPDIEKVESVRWYEPTATTYSDEMMTLGTWVDYQRALKRYASSSRASAYHMVGDVLYLLPVPDRNLTSGLAVFHSYCPAAVACTSSYDLPIPKAHDDLFVWYALMQGYARDRHSPMASQNQQLYGGLFGKAMARLMLVMGTPGMRLRTNR